MDNAPTIEIPLPSEHPGREDPSPASRDPLNALICALLDPYLSIEEIAENRKITVMRLGEILSGEPASSTIDALRKVFALRAELLALHARASAVGTLTRITNSGKDDEVARRAATSLLRMFRPDGTPAPLPPERDRAPDRGSERSGSSSPSSSTSATSPHAHTPAMRTSLRGCATSSEIAESSRPARSSLDDPTSPKRERGPSHPNSSSPGAARASPALPSERGGSEGRPPLRSVKQHHHRGDVRHTHRLQHAHDPP